jgi:Na+/H+-dicarboxylate symporter
MSLFPQVIVAVLLVTLTIALQSAGMAAFMHWGWPRILRGVQRLSPLRATVLLVCFTSMIVCLHVLQILLWATFYRRYCFSSWETSFYFSTASSSTVGYGDVVLPRGARADPEDDVPLV